MPMIQLPIRTLSYLSNRGRQMSQSPQVGVNFNINIDPFAIGQEIANKINLSNERGAFTDSTVETTFFALGQKYNVLTVNMNQHPQTGGLNKIVFYASVTYGDGTIFGIWGFKNGTFTHEGDGGWNNWAMKGWYDRSGDGNKHVIFKSYDIDMDLNEVLMRNNGHSQQDVDRMSMDDKRNTLISMLSSKYNVGQLQAMSTEDILGLAWR